MVMNKAKGQQGVILSAFQGLFKYMQLLV